ncbi:hypothetical protein IE53DRAFT_385955 [Violaceomyces palustris]|uniref:Uncharacterized protein n=1 Tax=Violaceomyces palustris TaxID=1673888 RepID=A0ACD0P0Q6_9BASI|nr:hypothetical protein IE53DRAFT_385955 [Violaceomyces palustris]
MENVTLLESSTTRAHFQLAKRLDSSNDARQSDLLILDTVAGLRQSLQKASTNNNSVASHLLTLLHALDQYPTSPSTSTPIDISFSLLPALQLISSSSKWSHLIIAHQLLRYLFSPPSSPSSTAQPSISDHLSASGHSAVDQASLLLLNSFRNHLVQSDQTLSRSRSGRSPQRSDRHERPARLYQTLSSLANGLPSGPSVLPSLATPLVNLTYHSDPQVRKLSLNAISKCSDYEDKLEDDAGEPLGYGEMTAAMAGRAMEMVMPSQGQSHAKVKDTVVETEPSVLRCIIRIVEQARNKGAITSDQALGIAFAVLQASGWVPLNESLSDLDDHDLFDASRARAISKSRAKLGNSYDYHGLESPWLVMACLDSIRNSLSSCSKSNMVPSSTLKRLEACLLRIYHRSSRGGNASLAVCTACARTIGCVAKVSNSWWDSRALGERDGEVGALWRSLTDHIRSQLHSENSNRKIASIGLLEGLIDCGWAGDDPSSPFKMEERDMGRLMGFLADPDESTRRRTLRVLDQIDPSIIDLHVDQLELATTGPSIRANPGKKSIDSLLTRAAESAWIRNRIRVSKAPTGQETNFIIKEASDYASVISRLVIGMDQEEKSGEELYDVVANQVERDTMGEDYPSRIHIVSILVREALTRSRSVGEEGKGGTSLCLLGAKLCLGLPGGPLEDQDPDREGSSLEVEIFQTLGELLVLSADEDQKLDLILAILKMCALGLESNQAPSSSLMRVSSVISKVGQVSNSKLFSKRAEQVTKLLGNPDGLIESLIASCRGRKEMLSLLDAGAVAEHYVSRMDASVGTEKRSASDGSKLGQRSSSSSPPHPSKPIRSQRKQPLIISFLAPSSTTESETLEPSNFDSSSITTGSRAGRPLRFKAYQNQADPPPDRKERERSRSKSDTSQGTSRSRSRSTSGVGIQSDGRKQVGWKPKGERPVAAKRKQDRRVEELMRESVYRMTLGDEILESDEVQAAESRGSPRDGGREGVSGERTKSKEEDIVLFSFDDEAAIEPRQSQAKFPKQEGGGPSLLELLRRCHNHNPWKDEKLTAFKVEGTQIGFLQPVVVEAILEDIRKRKEKGEDEIFVSLVDEANGKGSISLSEKLDNVDKRSKALDTVCRAWKEEGRFVDPLIGWREELYSVYGKNPDPSRTNVPCLRLERAACGLFGVATFGVHLTAYTPDMRIWVPKRSKTKSTWPGYYDNSVAGGITSGDGPFESMVRECEEEASLDEGTVRKYMKQTGVLSYFYQTPSGWCQPEVEYIYDLALPSSDIVLTPSDGEAESFQLMRVEEVIDLMKEGKFKANCVLVLLDFFIRHGLITAEDEPRYLELVSELHNHLGLPGP